MLIGEPRDELQRYLYAHVPASASWRISGCSSAETAMATAPHEAPNLVVFVCPQEDMLLCFQLHHLLEHAKLHWPYTFFIVVRKGPLHNLDALFERFGEMPVIDLNAASNPGEIIEREMASGAHGLVRGLSLPNLLQIMVWEQKSLSIRVDAQLGWGRLHLRRGQLVQAYSNASGQQGEPAVLEILTWDALSLRIERSYHNGQHGELRNLNHLLMDAMKKKDEESKQKVVLLPQELLFDDDTESAPLLPLQPHPESFREELHSMASNGYPVASNVRETLLNAMAEIDGALAASLVDYQIGMALETQGTGLDFDTAAAAHTAIVRAKLQMLDNLDAGSDLEVLLFTLKDHYHIIALVPNQPLFLHLMVCRHQGNPGMACSTLRAFCQQLVVV